MTIIMKEKNQITLPKKITSALGLERGAIFSIEISHNRIELIPLETKERAFTKEEYEKLEALSEKEKGKENKITKRFINNLKKG